MANFDLIINFNHSSAISNTIRYSRIDNTLTPTYTTVPGLTNGDSPYTVNVPRGQYRVYIQPIYADGRNCPELVQETAPCTGIISFSAAESSPAGGLTIDYVADGSLDAIQVNITYPNGGFSSSQHTNDGNPITVSIPPNLSGNYSVTISPVCDEDTGWVGAQTAPIIIPIVAANNSTLTNDTDLDWGVVGIKSNTGSGAVSIFNDTSGQTIGTTKTFYIPDGFYTAITVGVFSGGSVANNAILNTGSGSYVGSIVYSGLFNTTATITFSNVPIIAGCSIEVTTSP